MSWKDLYRSRVMSAPEAARIVQSGDNFWTPLGPGQPSSPIMDAIADRKDELEDVSYFSCLTLRPYKIFQPEYRKTFTLLAGFYSSAVLQAVARSEWANYWPFNASDVGQRYGRRLQLSPRRSGLIVQVTPPDEHGFVNLGLDTFYTESMMDQSQWIIAQVNSYLPRTFGQTNFHVSRFTAFVEHAEPLLESPQAEPSPVDVKLAENVMTLIRDRDCIQVGIGAVPAAISRLMENSGLRDLGIHTEMLPIGTNRLVEKGVVTCKYKRTHPGKIVTGFAFGDRDLYSFAGNNPMVEFYPVSYCNHVGVISREENMVAINGSIEIDLVGQVVSDSIGDVMRSGPGGQLDFTIGAALSPGGRAINLVPSTAANESVSRIVPYIRQGARVTVPRHYTQYVVTEYGVADLYARSEPERAAELIRVAHPKFREELEKTARQRGLLKQKLFAAKM
jgi:4-hydroxybutyrate CoA-transferase